MEILGSPHLFSIPHSLWPTSEHLLTVHRRRVGSLVRSTWTPVVEECAVKLAIPAVAVHTRQWPLSNAPRPSPIHLGLVSPLPSSISFVSCGRSKYSKCLVQRAPRTPAVRSLFRPTVFSRPGECSSGRWWPAKGPLVSPTL